jgi:hypothetical protein
MRFKPALYDDSDPFYAPCTGRTRDSIWWKVPRAYRELNYPGANVKLPGTVGDGQDALRAAEARRLTRAMLDHFGHGPQTKADTWAWLFSRYLNDEYSPFSDVKQNTAAGYRYLIDNWMRLIGDAKIGNLTFEVARKLQRAMQKSRSVSYTRRMFTMLRTVAHYGKALRHRPSVEASAVLTEMTLKTPPKRMVFPTREQVMKIVHEADARGLHDFACGLLLQWELALRAVDVRGQWFDIRDPDAGGVIRQSTVKRRTGSYSKLSRWQDGLTWDMIAPDFLSITKVISKTEKTLPEPTTFDLSDLPDLRARLRLLANNGRVGPVILSDGRAPYTVWGWDNAFRRCRRAAGVPDNIKAMDLRAGAVTEARDLGANPFDLRDMATHADVGTTNRYVRDTTSAISKVIKLRNDR